jgi:preprotein translocase subunit SecF
LVRWGLKPSIDFTGGAIIEIKNENLKNQNENLKVKIGEIKDIEVDSIHSSGEESFIIKLKPISEDKKNEIINKLSEEYGKIEELRFEMVGPILGKELIQKTFIAILLAAGFILLYLAYQFKDKMYGICAILAMFHDSLVILGIFSLLGHFKGVEIDTLFVTAILTSLSFSVHDTVVVYDRIRETLKIYPKAAFEDVVNKALTETMSRSVNNSLTIIIMLLCLFLFGGETIKWFVFALLIGTISGTYSSPFVATPLLVVWKRIKERRK